MDSTGFGFIIMLKGCKEFISQQVRKQKGTFENNWGNQIAEFGVYGEPNLQVIRDELDLCGYFTIITPEKMYTKEAEFL